MPGAVRHARPWERDGRETMNQLESAMEWRCGLPVAPRDATMTPAACSPPGRWQRGRQVRMTGRPTDGSRLGDVGG